MNDRADSCPSLRHFRLLRLQLEMLQGGLIANSRAHMWPVDCTGTCRAEGARVRFFVSVPDRQIVLLWI